MRKIVFTLSIFFSMSMYAQIDMIKIAKTIGPAIQLGGGFNFCMVPSRQNYISLVGGTKAKEEFTTMNSTTLGSELNIAISPIQMQYFSYNYKVNGSVGWLAYNTHAILYKGHEFKIGNEQIRGIFEMGTFKYRRTATYNTSYSASNSYEQKVGRSSYENIKRMSIGVAYTTDEGSEIELRYLREKYNFDNFRSNGVFASFTSKNKIKFYIESIWAHPIKGVFLINKLPTNLEISGLYLRTGILKIFEKKSVYIDLL